MWVVCFGRGALQMLTLRYGCGKMHVTERVREVQVRLEEHSLQRDMHMPIV